ncbi:MAG: flagellar hook-associated protein FlgK [Oscillospiraceae bacterium]
MRPTYLGFEASKSAIFSTQKSLDITGHNLANIATEGYTRQRVVQTSNYTDNTKTRYAPIKGVNDGEGITIKGVNQIRSDRLDTSYRTQNKEVGYFEQKNDMLSNIESILQEFDEGLEGSGYAISNSIREIYTALEDFSNNPTSEADANVVATAFNGMAQTLNQLYKGLEEYSQQCRTELGVDVADVNNDFAKLAELNKSIKTSVVANGYTDEYGPNELLDERNLILDKLSAYGDITVQDNIDGTINLTFNGHEVVNGLEYDMINYQENSSGTISLTWMKDGTDATKGTGKLKAYSDIINGAGVNASEKQSAENGIPYYMNKLDEFSATFAETFNNIIPNGTDANGNTTYVKIFGVQKDDGKVYPNMRCDAASITITDELRKNSSVLIEDKDVADNQNILKMISSLMEKNHNFDNNDFSGTFSDYVNSYVGTLASDVRLSENKFKAAENIANEVLNSRDSVSGVSESEETVNMLTYNRAYQAAARMMTVMDDLLDVLINRMAV